MSNQQHRPFSARAIEARHHILFAIIWADHANVGIDESGLPQALCHGFRGGGHVADRVSGVDFDQLLEDVMCELPRLIVDLSKTEWETRKQEHHHHEQAVQSQKFSPWDRYKPLSAILSDKRQSACEGE